MKYILKLSFVIITILSLSSLSVNAQRGSKGGDDDNSRERPENYVEPEVIIITATERGDGIYKIFIDTGIDKEGNKRKLGANEKEEQIVEKLVNNNSLPNLLNVLIKRGYILVNAYALQGSEIKHYFILSKQEIDEGQQYDDVKSKQRSNQNKPQLSPEEIERRKKMREKNRQ